MASSLLRLVLLVASGLRLALGGDGLSPNEVPKMVLAMMDSVKDDYVWDIFPHPDKVWDFQACMPKDTKENLITRVNLAIDEILKKNVIGMQTGWEILATAFNNLAKSTKESCPGYMEHDGHEELLQAALNLETICKIKGHLKYKPQETLTLMSIEVQPDLNQFVVAWKNAEPDAAEIGKVVGTMLKKFKTKAGKEEEL